MWQLKTSETAEYDTIKTPKPTENVITKTLKSAKKANDIYFKNDLMTGHIFYIYSCECLIASITLARPFSAKYVRSMLAVYSQRLCFYHGSMVVPCGHICLLRVMLTCTLTVIV